eukprot:CAMPEP_0174861572 /NCGR_PEP_ID=MMETSP1114-20130205/51940_1 /TAXON_ID=312471 /ORGANISM="Neobodo designis, Strain CCAP 1951/1" /LENGTH=719 /DNA_ID=CAMNT_0016096585 /DNA_START=44 /DNA_END=2203 /DNA_ORIENTATION=+
MKARLFVLALVCATAFASLRSREDVPRWEAPAPELSLFVAADGGGSDANNGTSPAEPLATVEAAVRRVAALRAATATKSADIVIRLQGGEHEVDRTLRMDHAVCGGEGVGKLSVTSYGDSLATLLGARRLELQPRGDGTYERVIDDPEYYGDSGKMVWSLWAEDGTRQLVDSTPFVATVGTPRFVNGNMHAELNESVAGDMSDAYAYVYHCWTSPISKVLHYNESTREAVFSNQNGFALTGGGGRVRVVNARKRDISPGSYTYAKQGRLLRYRPPTPLSDPTANVTVLYPRPTTLVEVVGCHDVEFSNVSFAFTNPGIDHCIDVDSCAGTQGSTMALTGALMVAHSQRVLFDTVEIRGPGPYALYFANGTKDSALVRSEVHDLGTGGIRIGIPVKNTVNDEAEQVSRITIAGTYIHDGNHVIEFGDGIFVQAADTLTLEHNSIHDLYYSGVGLGWTWDFEPTSNHDTTLRKNHIYNLGKGRLDELGCTHHLGSSPNTVFEGNLCHDIQAYDGEGYGLWTDQGSQGITMRNNVVYRAKGTAYSLHDSRNLTIDNNVFAFPQQIEFPNPPVRNMFAGMRVLISDGHKGGNASEVPLTFTRNIVINRNASAGIWIQKQNLDALQGAVFDYNCYWNTALASDPQKIWFPMKDGRRTIPNGTFADWQSYGYDAHSLVTDPMFPHADAYDFSDIDPASPCVTQLGFQPINLTDVGPQGYTGFRGF